MYRKSESEKIEAEDFVLPFEGKLSEDNRWVIMAELIPWAEFEDEYARLFDEKMGAPAKSFRMALAALIIQEKLGTKDRETVAQIQENPYLQYFIGLSKYSNNLPFNSSMMVYFRKRINREMIDKINRAMVKNEIKKKLEEEQEESKTNNQNRGKLILDASCSPADIAFPTDLGLLNKARKQTEKIIDILYKFVAGKLEKKPRTYRKKARREYLKIAKKKRPRKEDREEVIKIQLRYIRRNLASIKKLIQQGSYLSNLKKKDYQKLLVVAEIYRQQLQMNENKENRIDDRIVSIEQPHIRPIVRGKAGKSVEFGGKISASIYENFVFLDQLSWDNFNESQYLKEQVEKYKEYMGCYPESIHVDQIYRTRGNRAYCKEKGIRMSGKPLGRPPQNVSPEQKKQAREDEKIRNRIEGKFGEGKRRYGLNRIMAKLPQTSETVIAMSFLVMNLAYLYRQVLLIFLCLFSGIQSFWRIVISNPYLYVRQNQEKVILLS